MIKPNVNFKYIVNFEIHEQALDEGLFETLGISIYTKTLEKTDLLILIDTHLLLTLWEE